MWKLSPTDDYQRRHKRFEKDRPRELLATLDNLDTYFRSLEAGVKPLQIKHGFIHPEPLGVVAIDQKGGNKKGGGRLAETRLYVFPDTTSEILHIITLGDKRTQKEDIATCRNIVTELRKEQSKDHEEPNSTDEPAAT